MISDARFGEFETLVGEAVRDGARLVLGGKRWEGGREKGVEGAYFEPTMLVGVTKEMRIAREEGESSVLSLVSLCLLWREGRGEGKRTRADPIASPFSSSFFPSVFGPIMLILSYETVDEAVEIANSSRYG